jgi:SAM-dependent methyltransferase
VHILILPDRHRPRVASSYEPAGIVERLRDHIRAEGFVPVARRSLLWLAGYLRGAVSPPRAGTFTLGGENYRYVHHRYNATWLNERAVEVAVAERAVSAAAGIRVLEVGNVLAHYGLRTHRVVDRYERAPGVIRADVLEYDAGHPYDLIVSVSTLEHIGWDERPRDPARALAAIEHLKSLLAPGGKLLVTIPVGYNPELDRAIAEGSVAFTSVRAMRRCERRNSWREVDVADLGDARYDMLLYTAHGLLVCEYRKPRA